ncbi:hypothetical protein [Subtercola sp. RTI3]|uniref:hypothetical protein n=1 Tax=Subtercola sp. RTI3 TaxID=3048639 RepID=UPI002B225C87|nr:hypothetical protein [Subtercola sp. RTI3]MEA9984622.1 hypothetical protein [Subtercola sp. RTI3]
MKYQFTRSARKHRIGRGAAWEALKDAGEPTEQEDGTLRWVGADERGRELEIVGSPRPDEDLVLIIHVMPTDFTKGNRND